MNAKVLLDVFTTEMIIGRNNNSGLSVASSVDALGVVPSASSSSASGFDFLRLSRLVFKDAFISDTTEYAHNGVSSNPMALKASSMRRNKAYPAACIGVPHMMFGFDVFVSISTVFFLGLVDFVVGTRFGNISSGIIVQSLLAGVVVG